MYEPLNTILKLDEDTERRNTADDTLEGLSNELCHVLDLLHVCGLTLRLDGDSFTRGGVLRRIRQHGTQPLALLCGDVPRGKGLAQETMHKEIGIASDG